MSGSPAVAIYVSYFARSTVVIRNDVLVPIQVGRALSRERLGMAGDDLGENISDKNPRYCELTAQYWAWKNDRTSQYIGFMHYRRFLDFEPNVARECGPHGIVVDHFTAGFEADFGLTSEGVRRELIGFDMILPDPFELSGMNGDHMTVEGQYKSAPHHFAGHYELVRQVLRERSPADLKFFERVSRQSAFYPTNIFIFKRELFQEYCAWLFPILEELDNRIDVAAYTAQEARAIGYIAERLLNVFVLKKQSVRPDLKIKTLRRVFVDDPRAPEPPLLPIVGKRVVTVVASTDRAYVAHMAGLLASVLANRSRKRFIDFVILDGGLNAVERHLLTEMVTSAGEASLRFVDMSSTFKDVPIHSYFSRSTFYRLALGDLLPHHKKVVFLDTDMTVLGDVGELTDLDLGSNVIAAVPDLIMRTFCTMGVRSIQEAGGRPALQYIQDTLGVEAGTEGYFQAGTLVIDLDKLRTLALGERMINDLRRNRYWFLDQDVLNKHLSGRVKLIDFTWNVVSIPEDHLQYLTTKDRAQYERSHEQPKIVHYAGVGKPWETSDNPFSFYYWQYLRLTPWYEKTLLRAVSRASQRVSGREVVVHSSHKGLSWKVGSMFWRRLPGDMKRRLRPVATIIDETLRR